MSSHELEHLRSTVAANIDAAIEGAQLTNREVGIRIDASETQVWKWRKGATGISQARLLAIADLLGQPVSWFYTEHDDPKVAA